MKIFLAAPLTSAYRKDTGRFDPKIKRILQRIIKLLKENGHEVISAHEREKWGRDLMSPSEFTPLDMKLIKECDLVIAYINDKPSGVYIEIGWASALNKKIIILTTQSISELSPLVQGLSQITDTTIINFKNENELLEKLTKVLQEC
jgi:nucleoside 2-deoxyribosyltransferase